MKRDKYIYKKKSGGYEGRYVKGHDEDGKPRYGSVHAKTYGEVKARLAQVKSAAVAVNEVKTLKTALALHLQAVRSVIKPSTYGLYEGY
ncbi:MAG: site-specific integrase, partial [Clostridiales bacterium]|nr:site-specific integrase [Clostridiales bacterium]